MYKLFSSVLLLTLCISVIAQKKTTAPVKEEPKDAFNTGLLNGLQFILVAPAITPV